MKKIISCLLTAALLLTAFSALMLSPAAVSADVDVWDGTVATSYDGGSGTETDPYLISSAETLAYLAKQVNSTTAAAEVTAAESNTQLTFKRYFKLTCSVDLNNLEWTPIANINTGTNGVPVFAGYFDGDGHVVYNLKCTQNNKANAASGLFGGVYWGTVKNLGIESGLVETVIEGSHAAGLVATAKFGAVIENCYNKATVRRGFDGSWCVLGGIVGKAQGSITVRNCVNYGLIDGSRSAAWIAGNNRYAGILASAQGACVIENCYNLGNILGSANSKGAGVLAFTVAGTTIKNVYSSGAVTGTQPFNGYLTGDDAAIADVATAYTGDLIVYTAGHSELGLANMTAKMSGGGKTYGTVNTTAPLVVPTAFESSFLNETAHGNTLFAVEQVADISSYRGDTYTAPVKEGFLFAGWFTDAACTVALGKDVKSGSAYAKFVDSDVPDLRVQLSAGVTATSASTDLRLLTTVDSLSYSTVGFVIAYNGNVATKTDSAVFVKISAEINAGNTVTYAPTAFSDASEYFSTLIVKNVPASVFSSEIKVTPTWTTLDGTVVLGAESTVVISNLIAD